MYTVLITTCTVHHFPSVKTLKLIQFYKGTKKSEADIPEDRLIYAEVMYDVFYLN